MRKLNDILRHAAFFLNVLLLFILAMENNIHNLSQWMQVAGRLHPMVLHFPIVLWIVALAFEWMGRRRNQDAEWNDKIEFLLSFTAISAAAAAVFGMLLFVSGDYEQGNSLFWHKWLGTLTSLLAILLVWLRRMNRIIFQSALVAGVIIITIAGHLGAGITHGEEFLTAPLKKKREPIADITKAVAFRDIIQPIFEEKCTGCHNPNKAKGGLQLTTLDKIMKGGEEGIVIVPGSPDSSLLYQYLLLPMNDDKHMPPEGKPQPDPEDLTLIHWWIKNGAEGKRQVASLNSPDSIHKIIQQKYGEASPLDNLKLSFADPELIESLNNPVRTVRQLSADKPYIDIFIGSRKQIADKEWEELKAVSNQVVSIDCSHSEMNDKQATYLVNFPHLRQLHLQHTNITKEGIASIKRLKFLEYLNLSGTAVTSNIFTQLESVKSLKKLYLYETNISQSEMAQFVLSRPHIITGITPDLSKDTSFTGQLSEPIVKSDSTLFRDYATVQMNFRLKGVSIFYTTNGSTPGKNSKRYNSPLRIDSTCDLKVIAMKEGWKSSSIISIPFFRSRYQPYLAKLYTIPDKKYTAKKDSTLIDMEKGSGSHGDGKFLGFEGEHLDILLDLGITRKINSLSLGYLVNHDAFILSPIRVEVYAGLKPGLSMKKISVQHLTDTGFTSGVTQRASTHHFSTQSFQYIRIKAVNAKILPSWHKAKGKKSWIFADEISIN